MQNSIYTEELKNIKKKYYRVHKLRCPILNNKYVYFNQSGFRHFLRKKKILRSIKDQLRRFALFKYVENIILSSNTKISEVRIHNKAKYFALINEVRKDYFIKVIIRQIDSGEFYFLSVMDYKNKNSG